MILTCSLLSEQHSSYSVREDRCNVVLLSLEDVYNHGHILLCFSPTHSFLALLPRIEQEMSDLGFKNLAQEREKKELFSNIVVDEWNGLNN